MLPTLLSFTLLSSINALLHYTISEEMEVNSFVADVVKDATTIDNYIVPENAELQFTLLPDPEFNREYFKVEETSGILLIQNRIDRDTLCPPELSVDQCRINIDLAIIQPVESFHVFSIEITIEDINDHVPEFDQDNWVISLPENSPITDFVYPVPIAKDLDSGINAVVQYSISSSTDHPFSIYMARNSDGIQRPYLSLKKQLDREIVATYSLLINAYDGDSPPNAGSLLVTVIVTDVNDNSPVFESPQYNFTITEDAEAPSLIGTVSATDKDEGLNSLLSYEMISPSRELYADLFHINNTSGDVFLSRQLDSNYRDVYGLLIGARDQGTEPRTTTVKIYIRVEDTNTHAPNLTIMTTLTKSGQPEIMENQPSGTFVSYGSVQDLDRGRNGEVSCHSMNSDFILQLMHTRTYKILTAVTFDREERDRAKLEIECKDRGVTSLKSLQEIDVVILDENDNAPLFERDNYEVNLMENTPIGHSILTVLAFDKDSGIHQETTYILKSTNQYVDIQPDTNVIVTKQTIDYEKTPEIELEVIAFNKAKPTMSSTATVQIYVHNENDCTPIFTQKSYRFGVFENSPLSTDIGTVSAVDCDAPPFNEFYYQLPVNTETTNIFFVDPYTGKIAIKTELDRETTAVHYFAVYVTDAHNLFMTSITNVTVFVADKNDNKPTIEFPSDYNDDLVYLSVDSPIGHVLATVRATDADTGINSQLLYNFTTGADISFFDIDIQNGVISVSRSLAGLGNKKIQLGVTVSDRGTPKLSTTAMLNVYVNESRNPGKSQLVYLPKASATRSTIQVSHQQILLFISAITILLVLVLVSAILWIRCQRKPSITYLRDPDKLSLQYLDESTKPSQSRTGLLNGKVISCRNKSAEIHGLFKPEQIKAGTIKSPQYSKAFNVHQQTTNIDDCTMIQSKHVSMSCLGNLYSDNEQLKGKVSNSSGFQTLMNCDCTDYSVSPSFYESNETQSSAEPTKVMTSFLPHNSSNSRTQEKLQVTEANMKQSQT